MPNEGPLAPPIPKREVFLGLDDQGDLSLKLENSEGSKSNRAVSKESLPKTDRGSPANQAAPNSPTQTATKKRNKGEFSAQFAHAKSLVMREAGESKKKYRQRVLAQVKANLKNPGVWSESLQDKAKARVILTPPLEPLGAAKRKGKGKGKKGSGKKGKGKGKSKKSSEPNAAPHHMGAGIEVPKEGVLKGILEKARDWKKSGGSQSRKESFLAKSKASYQKRLLRPPGMPPMMPYEDPAPRVRLGDRFSPKGKGKDKQKDEPEWEDPPPFWMRRKWKAGNW